MDKITLEVTNEQFDLIMKALESQEKDYLRLSKFEPKHPGIDHFAKFLEGITGIKVADVQAELSKTTEDISILKGQLLNTKREASRRHGCSHND